MKTRSFMRLVRALSDRRGVTALEYGLVAALAAVAIITAMANMGASLESVVSGISGKLTSTAAGIN
ncbi:Flp family type IVb pilin [Azospirillum sp. TSO22-1]|uniref:Flp family type IVb pilin n=1 Tax=Azospirillum sp. TSO22-1 TaxID=716789 RepID=UPI000D61286C|nr:Flp family type IVb pilin [Azospirillum sp. TSO22-1]PWC42103.1 hypothetical protein TSO221_22180 [Azospirillum sp. TSO22-1]